ncbi:neural proliferation differentiation and control protein 1-like [Hypanus sabinus]|uniref:neural proliferation differentiation and control protein 1-like n=1 Tax=Hypanus sabinus TaxID=79690 RepID=UPI0028C4FCD1|nr:neural proliferation differentiation and control protein 1-like [Hypanus sabinus]
MEGCQQRHGENDGRPQASSCPSPLDCALRRRNHCPTGSQDCGPCLSGYREDGEEKCALTEHQRHDVVKEAAKVDGLLQSLLAQWEKTSPQSSSPGYCLSTISTPPEPRPEPTDTSLAASLHNPPSAHQRATESQATVKTTPDTHPVTGRNGSRRLPRLLNDVVSMALIIICAVTGLCGLLVAALCWYRLQKEVRLAQKVVYEGSQQPLPPFIDRRIAEKLQRTHYQHQKKVIQALGESKPKVKRYQTYMELELDNGNEEYLVYECPGLAPTGEMEIHNPLFDASVHRSSSSIHQ